jgi:ketosteroid isomerase-like protein
MRVALILWTIIVLALSPPPIQARAAQAAYIDQLLTRAQRLADTVEIKRVQCEYGYYLDRSDWEAVLDLFTDDITAEYGNSGVFRGKEHVRALLYAIGYGQSGLRVGQLRDHIQLQPVIDLAPDGQSALGRWKALVLLGQYGEYARWQTGPYENEYRKEGGRWKISRIHWFETFTVPYEGGWKVAMPQSNVADRKIPTPDSPPTFKKAIPWPVTSLPPVHYPNPGVTPPKPARVALSSDGNPGGQESLDPDRRSVYRGRHAGNRRAGCLCWQSPGVAIPAVAGLARARQTLRPHPDGARGVGGARWVDRQGPLAGFDLRR